MPVVFKPVSAMEKCFLDEDIASKKTISEGTALRGEEFAFELAYTSDDCSHFPRRPFRVTVDSPLAEWITVRQIESVPVRVPCYGHSDDNYLRKTAGLYPDLIAPMDPRGAAFATYGQLKSLWITVDVPESCAGGDYPVTIRCTEDDGTVTDVGITLHVLDAVLPKQETIVTEWFHTDCIANYYDLETFSDKHWEYIGNFMRTAVKNGINTILTPVFTPPLDTAVGGERRTTQLVDVWETEDGWSFGFDRLEKWVHLAQSVGVEYFEISHLYTQWGVAHAPKVMGTDRQGTYRRLFGWETDSLSDEYRTFLRAFLTAFTRKMKELGVDKQCLYHISDEPGLDHLEAYSSAKAQIADLLDGYVIMDALSNFEFYKTGAVAHPIPASNHIEPFIEAGVPDLWVYYCCGQSVDVSNRFLAMSMARTRTIGVQMWKYNITGFLQWGYNFYNSCHSVRAVDPYLVTDGDYWVPAGDCFSVYPGENGEALESLHLKGFTMALQDLRAMKLAEAKVGREKLLEIVDAEEPVTFSKYPRREDWITEVREKINELLK